MLQQYSTNESPDTPPLLSRDTGSTGSPLSPITPRSWLEHFPAARRSAIANWYHSAVRNGARTPAAVVHQVQQTVLRRLDWASAYTDTAHLHAVLEALQTDRAGALAYAESVIAWEALSYAERQRQKQARSQHFREQHLATQPVTDPQLRYLQSLGYTGEVPASRADASALIDQILRARRGGSYEPAP